MPSGKSTKLTGQIGEQLVSAMLGTKGFYATPFSGNVPGFDLIATNAETLESIPIQVKTSNGGFDLIATNAETLESIPIQVKTSNGGTLAHSTITKWIEVKISENGVQTLGEPLTLAHPNMLWIMVKLEDQDLTTARFFIATAQQIQDTMIKHYQKMLDKHNGIRPRNPRTLHCALFLKDLSEYEDNWDLIK